MIVRRFATLAVLALLTAAAGILSLKYGALAISWEQLREIFFASGGELESRIILELRLPRTLLGMLTGAAFAVSGALLQGVMRNPLASPDIIGVSAGGGLAGILILLLWPAHLNWQVPASFAGALSAALLVYALAWKRGVSPLRLILSGVAVAGMLGALGSAVMLFHADKVGGVLHFTIGSLSSRGWVQVEQVRYYILFGVAAAFLLGGRLNVLALGDETASGLGLRVESTRFLLLAVAALLAAAGVAAAGLLAFAGLIAPHVTRLLIGADHRFLIPGSALTGALLVVSCDTVGRIVAAPAELPAGILMALLGPPFFLYLLRSHADEA